MTDMTSAPRRPRRQPAPGPAADLTPDERIAELELRVRDLEAAPGIRARGRTLMNRVVPPEAARHFRNAGREQLLGVRSIVDHWISRLDEAESRSRRTHERETIEIE